jgi:DNA-binding transcriptional ArsR family regulator
MRILHAMSAGAVRTTADLCASLPGASQASVYRHVRVLADAGVLEVVGERRIRGAVERRYRLRAERAMIDRDLAASMSLDDHRSGFAAAMATLVAEFNAYLEREPDPMNDSVGYRQVPVWLNQREIREMMAQLRDLILASKERGRGRARRLYLFSPIVFPIQEPLDEGTPAPGAGDG